MTGKIDAPPKINNIFTVEGIPIGMMPDPAHLLKNSKGLWFRHGKVEIHPKYLEKFKLKYKYAEWKWIPLLIEFDEKHEKGVANHLNRKLCLNMSTWAAMDCKPALAIFNIKTASAIEYMVKYEGWSEEALTTAQYIRLWARWFQIMGAYQPEYGFDVEKPDDRNSKIDFIIMFMDFYATCKYFSEKRQHRSLWVNQQHVLCASTTMIWLQDRMLSQEEFRIFLPGFVLGHSVENLHTSVRNVNPLPTPLLYKRILKGIAMTQMFKDNVQKSNYQEDPGDGWLVGLSDLKKLQQPDPEELANIELFEEVETITALDFSQDAINSFIAGGILNKVIGYKKIKGTTDAIVPICMKCFEFWSETSETSNHVLNALIECREYAPDSLLRPSDLGHQIFRDIELLFIQNRDKDIDKQGLIDAFTTFLFDKISEMYENIPSCHFEAIIKKTVKTKWHHYSTYLNREFIEVNKDEINREANSSKTTKANAFFNGAVLSAEETDYTDLIEYLNYEEESHPDVAESQVDDVEMADEEAIDADAADDRNPESFETVDNFEAFLIANEPDQV